MNRLSTDHSGSEATINLSAMAANLEFLKRRSGVTDVLAVVKADAYSHGAVKVAGYLESRVSGFAVATVDEGIQLRRSGISRPVLVFGVPDPALVEALIKHRLTATVSHPEHLQLLKPGSDYHVNFDTGMRRIGLFPSQVGELLHEMKRHPSLECSGVYSHYATADDPGSDTVFRQNELFRQIRSMLSLDLPCHMSNSAAVVHYDLDHFDMIRVGIGLTGYTPGQVQCRDLQPVLDWKTEVVQVRRIKSGDPVSYGGSWRAPASGYLATLPVGYADGVSRALSNRLRVGIDGVMVPVVGNITMDFCMVFLGEREVEVGTTVQLIGDGGLRADDWARLSGSITHEILCRLTPRVRRRYRT